MCSSEGRLRLTIAPPILLTFYLCMLNTVYSEDKGPKRAVVKLPSRVFSRHLANKYIIFISAQWRGVAWDDPTSASGGITVS